MGLKATIEINLASKMTALLSFQFNLEFTAAHIYVACNYKRSYFFAALILTGACMYVCSV